MTEQTQKLDVKTLEYVLSMIREKKDTYVIIRNSYKKRGDEEKANKCFDSWLTLDCLADNIYELIERQGV